MMLCGRHQLQQEVPADAHYLHCLGAKHDLHQGKPVCQKDTTNETKHMR